MRRLLLLALLALTACAHTPAVERATMPLSILREAGHPARMAQANLRAGSNGEGAPFSFDVWFASDGDVLGPPKSVGWTVNFLDYCADHYTWLQTVVIGPSGQVWRGYRVGVPPGPDRRQYWSTGSSGANGPGAQATPGLLDAIAEGGLFTVALEDQDGRRFREAVIDTLTPAERQKLFRANRAKFAATDPNAPPVRSDMLLAVESPPFAMPDPPRACPVTASR